MSGLGGCEGEERKEMRSERKGSHSWWRLIRPLVEAIGLGVFLERKTGRLGELEGRKDLTRGAKRPHLGFSKIALIYEKEGL